MGLDRDGWTNFPALDEELGRTLTRFRRALVTLDRPLVPGGDDADPDNPLDTTLVARAAELADRDDELWSGLRAWLELLAVERDAWSDRVALARRWREPQRLTGVEQPVSLRELRADVLRQPVAGLREERARALVAAAGPASDLAVAALVRRLEREGPRFLAADASVDLAPRAAQRLLSRTDDVAEEALGRGWSAALHAAVGAGAREGWPARLTSRWLGAVFAGPELLVGLRVELGPLPKPWGAASFARALGSLGVAVLQAGRPRSAPLSLHQRPRGTRRHLRYALFASLVGEPSFALRVLGLGRDRAVIHGREVARAFCASLRFAALRVALSTAMLTGESAARDRHAELGQRLFGEGPPRTLLAVVPQLRPADGAALVGALLAAPARDALVRAHDEDWYKNPRAIEALRADDVRPAGPAPTVEELDAAVDRVGSLIERSIG